MNAKRLVLVLSEDDDVAYVYGVLPKCDKLGIRESRSIYREMMSHLRIFM